MNGRGERIRTFDPLVPNQMRYQAALHPDLRIFYLYLQVGLTVHGDKICVQTDCQKASLQVTCRHCKIFKNDSEWSFKYFK